MTRVQITNIRVYSGRTESARLREKTKWQTWLWLRRRTRRTPRCPACRCHPCRTAWAASAPCSAGTWTAPAARWSKPPSALCSRCRHDRTVETSWSAAPSCIRLARLQLESLELRRLRLDLVFTYKLVFGLMDVDVSDFFKLRCDDRNRGHQYKFFLPGYTDLALDNISLAIVLYTHDGMTYHLICLCICRRK